MNGSEIFPLVDQIARGGIVVALLMVIIGGHYGLWVYGRTAAKREQELEARIKDLEIKVEWWQNFSLSLLNTATKAVDNNEQAISNLTRRR